MQPDFGQRTVTSVIDLLANTQPEKLYAVYPKTSSFSGPLQYVTYADFSRAINRASWWLEDVLGTNREPGLNVIAWIGPNDLRYCVLAIAANKTAYTLLLPSPRNSAAFHVHVFRSTNCRTLLRDSSFDIGPIKTEMNLREVIVPSMEWFLDPKPIKEYPYVPNPTSMDEKFLILHSSGSTGLPNCITYTHRTFAALDAVHKLSEMTTSTPLILSIASGPLFNPFPMFHAAGLIMNLCFAIFYDHSLVLPPAGQLRADTLIDALEYVDVSVVLSPSSILEEIALNATATRIMSKVKDVLFGGGPVSEAKVSQLSKCTRLTALIATTEAGLFPLAENDSGEFNWFAFPTELKGIEFRESVNGLYEMVFIRDELTDRFHFTWVTFPERTEYSTKDLYTKHASKAGLWKHYGRLDDVVVLSNGEKLVAPPLEAILCEAPEVTGALVFGQGQFEIGILIQRSPHAELMTEEDVLNCLDGYIQKGNRSMPRFANLTRDRVVFTNVGKPMIRAPKGSIIRSETIKLYDEEIRRNYSRTIISATKVLPILSADFILASQSIRELFEQTLGLAKLDDNINVFELGLDSLGVLQVIRKVQSNLRAEAGQPSIAERVTPNLIYDNPTPLQFTKALRRLEQQDDDGEEDYIQKRGFEIETILNRYVNSLPDIEVTRSGPVAFPITVVLTGSTGSLGSYLLDSLISSDKISCVYALNRSNDGAIVQQLASRSRKLSTDFQKVIFLKADLSMDKFGLSIDNYNAITSSAHLFLHTQWQVELNLPLDRFEPQIAGVRNILELAINSPLHPRIVFTSSIGAVGSYPTLHPTESWIPETIHHDPQVPLPVGYAESKHIGERLLHTASKKTGISVTIARIGQIAGPIAKTGGGWNKTEWFPCLIASSSRMKLLPADLGAVSHIDWIPVDVLGDVLLELATLDCQDDQEGSNRFSVYNIANPKLAEWKDFIPTVLRYLPEETQVVPMPDWIASLGKLSSDSGLDTADASAVKLLSFYELLCQKDIKHIGGQMEIVGSLRSPSLRQLEAIDSAWLESWLRSWKIGL